MPLDKWLTAIWMLTNCKNGISSYEDGRDLGVTQKSAWFMLHRIRLAMQDGSFVKLGGNGRKSKWTKLSSAARLEICTTTNASAGLPRLAPKTRLPSWESSSVAARSAHCVRNRKKPVLQTQIREHVEAGSAVYTDALMSYEGLSTRDSSTGH